MLATGHTIKRSSDSWPTENPCINKLYFVIKLWSPGNVPCKWDSQLWDLYLEIQYVRKSLYWQLILPSQCMHKSIWFNSEQSKIDQEYLVLHRGLACRQAENLDQKNTVNYNASSHGLC